jgi:hypothetical protein
MARIFGACDRYSGEGAGRFSVGDEDAGLSTLFRWGLLAPLVLLLAVASLGAGCTADEGSNGSGSTDVTQAEEDSSAEEDADAYAVYRADVAGLLGEHFAIVYAQGESGYTEDDDPEDFRGQLAYLAGQANFLAERSTELTAPAGYEDTHEALVDALEWDAEWREREHEMALDASSGTDLVEGSARVGAEMARDDYYLETVFQDLGLSEADVVDAYCRSQQADVLEAIDELLEADPEAGAELAGTAWMDVLWEFEEHTWLCPTGADYEYDAATGTLECPVHGDSDRPDPLESGS